MPLPSRQSYKQSRSAILAAPGRSMGTGTTGQKQLWRSRFRDCAPEADYAVLKAPSCLELLELTIRRSQGRYCRADVRFTPESVSRCPLCANTGHSLAGAFKRATARKLRRSDRAESQPTGKNFSPSILTTSIVFSGVNRILS